MPLSLQYPDAWVGRLPFAVRVIWGCFTPVSYFSMNKPIIKLCLLLFKKNE